MMYTFGRRPSLFLCLLLGVCLILILCDAANTSIYIKDSLAAFFPTASSSTKESSIVDDDDEDTPTPTSSKEEEKEDDQQQQQQRTNLLMIISDQFRYDAIRFVQDLMPEYDGKLKVRTPNLDRLARQGVYFSNAYAQTASCVPARAALRTGCTGHRTGVQGNVMIREEAYSKIPGLEQKIRRSHTYDQVLDSLGYDVENYGKYHLPLLWQKQINGSGWALRYNGYSLNYESPVYEERAATNGDYDYQAQANAWVKEARNNNELQTLYEAQEGQPLNPRTGYPYTPLSLDWSKQVINSEEEDDDTGGELSAASNIGIDSLPAEMSVTSFTGYQGVLAIQRLAQQSDPWALTVGFENPHPPFLVTQKYAEYYLQNKTEIMVPPNIGVDFDTNIKSISRQQVFARSKGFGDAAKVQEWAAIYYGMVEQVDVWIGKILDELDAQGLANNTLVIFTADHGEMLGAFGMQGKVGFFEEAVHIPLLMRLPNTIEPGTTVDRPVAHLDVFATIMDYLGYSSHDNSDGKSLRPAISGLNYGEDYDSEYAVSETIVGSPNFMIRHGNWKLWIARRKNVGFTDLLYNLQSDPHEKNNLLVRDAANSLRVIGKAEHLKCLLLEWMTRNDGGTEQYYSDPKWNRDVGLGDIQEVFLRRTWNTVDQWLSDRVLSMKAPVFVEGKWRSNAWLYIGRTAPGTLMISDIILEGTDTANFSVDMTEATIESNDYIRVKVSFQSEERLHLTNFDVQVIVKSNVYNRRGVRIDMAHF